MWDWLGGLAPSGTARSGTIAAVAVAVGVAVGVVGPAATGRPARAADPVPAPLAQVLTRVAAADLVPGADTYGPVAGAPPVAPVLRGGQVIGYAFLNADHADAIGYSGKPIRVLVGLARDGTITGARLIDHKEPIVLIGIPETAIGTFIKGYLGRSVLRGGAESANPPVDIVSGATVTVMVIGDSILRSAIRVARAQGLGSAVGVAPPGRTLAPDSGGEPRDWDALVGDGSVRRLVITVAEINRAFAESGNPAAAGRPEPGADDEIFMELAVAPVSVPAIGRALLGDAAFDRLHTRSGPERHAILVAGRGRYSFKGSGYVRGGIFDRIELQQDDATLRFHDRDHQRISRIAAVGAPEYPEIGIFHIPAGGEFDPAAPWRLQLLVQRATGARDKAFLTFAVPYQVPERYLAPASAATNPAAHPETGPADSTRPAAPAIHPTPTVDEAIPLWQRLWQESLAEVAVLVTALLILTGIFFFQHQLVRRPRLYDRVRVAFLIFTLFWLGWWMTAQLSIVNVLTVTNALIGDFRWDYFLMSPLIFILWCAVAAALLFWGRGAYCGWLCPFGALQELTNRAGRRLGVPQVQVPWGLHERLWPIKYIIFLALFGLSLHSLTLAEQAAEIEPFKTAIVLRFMREGPFVAFALGLLVINLVIERFFCRYLCPLGAALAIPARLRMFDWLRRYRECGHPCQRCAHECPVQSIHPEGHINVNECISCLHCQMLYHHDTKCPVMIQKRLKRARQAAVSPGTAPVPFPGAGST